MSNLVSGENAAYLLACQRELYTLFVVSPPLSLHVLFLSHKPDYSCLFTFYGSAESADFISCFYLFIYPTNWDFRISLA